MDDSAPTLLNVLRVCDIAEAAGMLAPRELTIADVPSDWSRQVAAIFRSAGAPDKFVCKQ
jgi:hypothetical protein